MSFRVDKLSAVATDGRSSPMALRVLFVDDLPESADREPNLQFEEAAVERAIQRVRDYEALFPSGTVAHVTNSIALVRFYGERFRPPG